MQADEGRIGVLHSAADACAAGAVSDLVIVDVRGPTMKPSTALTLPQLPGQGWGFSTRMPPAPAQGVLYVYGGPAGNRGRLVVDATTDPPGIVRYETFSW
jgi:hypothetical protein